jgi:hypothetical protein
MKNTNVRRKSSLIWNNIFLSPHIYIVIMHSLYVAISYTYKTYKHKLQHYRVKWSLQKKNMEVKKISRTQCYAMKMCRAYTDTCLKNKFEKRIWKIMNRYIQIHIENLLFLIFNFQEAYKNWVCSTIIPYFTTRDETNNGSTNAKNDQISQNGSIGKDSSITIGKENVSNLSVRTKR